jgi:cyclopropane fatty-acyl-phospholipid synthase-like methyltransferase
MSHTAALRFPSFYLVTQGILGGKRARRKYIEEYAKVERGMRVLDIGCGPGYVVTYLPQVSYFGFDISEPYIAYANKKYGAQGKFFPRLFDSEMAKELAPVDVILMAGLLHHLNDADVIELLVLSRKTMRDTGRLVTLDPCYESNQSAIAKFLMNRDRGDSIRKSGQYKALASQVFQQVKLHIRHDLFFVPYTAAIMVCELT